MKYNVIRVKAGDIELEGETVATGLTTPEFEDTGVESGKRYEYIVEAYTDDGQYQDRNVVFVKKLPTTNIFVSNKELTWADLPAWQQPDNGSLKLLSQEIRDNVPVVVETGEVVERLNPITKELEQVPETKVEHETRAVFTYEADFDWDNDNRLWLTWLVDVLQFKNNQLKSGSYAFRGMPAAQLTDLPDLDTSNVTNMVYMFSDAIAFNQPLDFDTSNVTDMEFMFDGADGLNQPLDFDTSNVTNMRGVFVLALAFDKILAVGVFKVLLVSLKNLMSVLVFKVKPLNSLNGVRLVRPV